MTTPYEATDVAYDYAVGGIPFLSAVGPQQAQYVRETAPYRKEQFDSAKDVGEQSLVYWWLKSQSSFHGGAGQKFLDTALNNDPDQSVRFYQSQNVDVWTPGQVTLLPVCENDRSDAATGQRIFTAVDGSTDVYFWAGGTSLRRGVGSGVTSAVTWGGAGNILDICTDGSNYLAADATGIYRGTLAGGAGALVWNTGSSKVALGWAKQRLVAGIGPSIYELSGAGPALPAAKYTHPDANWTWTSISEGPNAIYAAGYSGANSAVFKFTLDSAGVVPTLTAGVTVAELPPGEIVWKLYSYLGSYLALGTQRGLRVATFDANGNLTYSPRVFDSNNHPIKGIVGDDRFLYCGVGYGTPDGNYACLYRVDLSQPKADGGYAWATDLQPKDAGVQVFGEVTGVAMLGRFPMLCVEGKGTYIRSQFISTPVLEPSGWLTTSKIRYGTVEPKLAKYVRLRAAPLVGTIAVSMIDPAGTTTALASYNTQGAVELDEQSITADPLEFLSLKVTLSRWTTITGPEFRSYQLKSLPAAKRQRLESLPLLCYDREKDRSGQHVGKDGNAWSRLAQLEALEQAGAPVLLQRFASDTSDLVVIDALKFVQSKGPSTENGFGGVVLLSLRSVD